MSILSISEVSQQTGLPPSTLRYYEEVGLVMPSGRKGNRRLYDDAVLQRLALIRTGQQAGFTLAELKILLDNVLGADAVDVEWQDLILRKLKEMDTLLQNVKRMKGLLEDIMDCDDSSLAECIVLTGQKYQVAPNTDR